MTDHDHPSRAPHLLFRTKASAQHGFNAENFEIVCRHKTAGEALCDAVPGMNETEGDPTIVVRREPHRFENAVLAPPVDEVRRRSVMIIVAVLRIRFPYV